jgi:isoleucyl-tRNA synthetase
LSKVNWDQPYLTLDKKFEASQIKLFGEMVFKGYIYRGLPTVKPGPSSQTALAEAELEYPSGHVSKSIYVGFRADQISKILTQEISNQAPDLLNSEGKLNEIKLVIWTTTPWTIPANEAIAVNQKLDYVIAQSSDKSLIIIANDLLEDVCESVGIHYEKKVLIKGSILDGISLSKDPVLMRSFIMTLLASFNTFRPSNFPVSFVKNPFASTEQKIGNLYFLQVLKSSTPWPGAV